MIIDLIKYTSLDLLGSNTVKEFVSKAILGICNEVATSRILCNFTTLYILLSKDDIIEEL